MMKSNVAFRRVEITQRQRTAKVEADEKISQDGLRITEQQVHDGVYVGIWRRMRNAD